MQLTTKILSTTAGPVHTMTVETASPGLDRATIAEAERLARAWALEHGHKVVSDIVSQGVYRVWVEPIPARRLSTLRQIASTNARLQGAAA